MVLPLDPPAVTNPLNVDPVSPLASVTLPSNATGPVALIPERACTVESNVVAPVPLKVSAAPVPLPSAAMPPTASPKVVGPLPELTARFLFPSTVDANTIGELVLETVAAAPTDTGLLKVMAPAAVLATLPSRVMLLPEVAV